MARPLQKVEGGGGGEGGGRESMRRGRSRRKIKYEEGEK
jgi:hypothetical protein